MSALENTTVSNLPGLSAAEQHCLTNPLFKETFKEVLVKRKKLRTKIFPETIVFPETVVRGVAWVFGGLCASAACQGTKTKALFHGTMTFLTLNCIKGYTEKLKKELRKTDAQIQKFIELDQKLER